MCLCAYISRHIEIERGTLQTLNEHQSGHVVEWGNDVSALTSESASSQSGIKVVVCVWFMCDVAYAVFTVCLQLAVQK